jgi:hypothetical protein
MAELATSRLSVVLDKSSLFHNNLQIILQNINFHRSMKLKFAVKLEHNISNITHTFRRSGCCELPMFHHKHCRRVFIVGKKLPFAQKNLISSVGTNESTFSLFQIIALFGCLNGELSREPRGNFYFKIISHCVLLPKNKRHKTEENNNKFLIRFHA